MNIKEIGKKAIVPCASAVLGGAVVVAAIKFSPSAMAKVNGEADRGQHDEQVYDDIFKKQESKFALEGATEALWYEVRPWKIKVCLIQPGFINSNSFKNVKLTRESQRSLRDKNNPYYYHSTSMAPFIAKMMKLSPSTPEDIAKKIHKVVDYENPPLRVPVTLDAYFFGIVRKLLPRTMYHALMYYSLPKVFRWGEDGHYHMDAEYERNSKQNEKTETTLLLSRV